MPVIDPQYLSFKYELEYRGAPGIGHDPEDYPLEWKVGITAAIFDDEFSDPDEDIEVGEAYVTVIPDAGEIELFLTLDAVDQDLANLAEMLMNEGKGLMGEAGFYDGEGGDLMYISGMYIKPEFRGIRLGHAVLDAVLRTIGRSCPMVILQAAPVLEEDDFEGSPEHMAAKAALSKYWQRYGFMPVAKGYLVFGEAFTPEPDSPHFGRLALVRPEIGFRS